MKAALAIAATIAVLAAAPSRAAPPGPSLVDTAIAVNGWGPFAGAFDLLIAAVGAADPAVGATLDGNGQHTVFAPTDDAFVRLLGVATEEQALAIVANLDTAVLTEILLYHVAKGRRNSDAVIGARQLRMLQGGFVYRGGVGLVDSVGRSVGLVATDVPAANGIIHAIDGVLLPFPL
jgi:uncharacterized surface protein with fasciclin (FAS1) repeats